MSKQNATPKAAATAKPVKPVKPKPVKPKPAPTAAQREANAVKQIRDYRRGVSSN